MRRDDRKYLQCPSLMSLLEWRFAPERKRRFLPHSDAVEAASVASPNLPGLDGVNGAGGTVDDEFGRTEFDSSFTDFDSSFREHIAIGILPYQFEPVSAIGLGKETARRCWFSRMCSRLAVAIEIEGVAYRLISRDHDPEGCGGFELSSAAQAERALVSTGLRSVGEDPQRSTYTLHRAANGDVRLGR